MVVDLGILRNNRQKLVNTLDAAALAGGVLLPIDGSVAGKAAAATSLITKTIDANYPGLPSSAYTITYKCLVGVDPATNRPWVSRDVPAACDPRPSMGLGTTLPPTSAFSGAGPTRNAPCNPGLGDKCNVVVINGSASTPFSLRPGRRGEQRIDGGGHVGRVQWTVRELAGPASRPRHHSRPNAQHGRQLRRRRQDHRAAERRQGRPRGLRPVEAARRPCADRPEQGERSGSSPDVHIVLPHGVRLR